MVKRHKNAGPSQRMLRVGELVRHAVAGFLARDEVADEALYGTFITVPEVRMSSDLKWARVYIVPLGEKEAGERIVKALNRHAKFIRGRIASDLALKFSPALKFFLDATFDEAHRIDALLRSDHVRQDLDTNT